MKTIVTLVDFNAASSKVLNHTRTLAKAFDCDVVLMHIISQGIPVAFYGAEISPLPLDPTPETIHAEMSKLYELLAELTRHGVHAWAQQFIGPVVETIMREAPRMKPDLVIMGAHQHHALYHKVIGSTTADVLKRASFPVLVVPCDTVESKQA